MASSSLEIIFWKKRLTIVCLRCCAKGNSVKYYLLAFSLISFLGLHMWFLPSISVSIWIWSLIFILSIFISHSRMAYTSVCSSLSLYWWHPWWHQSSIPSGMKLSLVGWASTGENQLICDNVNVWCYGILFHIRIKLLKLWWISRIVCLDDFTASLVHFNLRWKITVSQWWVG